MAVQRALPLRKHSGDVLASTWPSVYRTRQDRDAHRARLREAWPLSNALGIAEASRASSPTGPRARPPSQGTRSTRSQPSPSRRPYGHDGRQPAHPTILTTGPRPSSCPMVRWSRHRHHSEPGIHRGPKPPTKIAGSDDSVIRTWVCARNAKSSSAWEPRRWRDCTCCTDAHRRASPTWGRHWATLRRQYAASWSGRASISLLKVDDALLRLLRAPLSPSSRRREHAITRTRYARSQASMSLLIEVLGRTAGLDEFSATATWASRSPRARVR